MQVYATKAALRCAGARETRKYQDQRDSNEREWSKIEKAQTGNPALDVLVNACMKSFQSAKPWALFSKRLRRSTMQAYWEADKSLTVTLDDAAGAVEDFDVFVLATWWHYVNQLCSTSSAMRLTQLFTLFRAQFEPMSQTEADAASAGQDCKQTSSRPGTLGPFDFSQFEVSTSTVTAKAAVASGCRAPFYFC